jgi:hypothetical protein
MFFLVLAFSSVPHGLATGFKSVIKPKTAFFLFWILFFVVSHLWNFSTAPWNGNGLFDDSAVDLLYLKNYVIGHPFQPAWFHERPFPYLISRETLFHYYVWGFLRLFGYNIVSYEAALLVIWCAAFTFTLLYVDLLFRSLVVTSIAALIFNFLPLAFIYTFVGYRYPMTIFFCVASLYFLHLGFTNRPASSLHLALGGITAGLCFASSILGKQYLLALGLFALLYAGLHWKRLKRNVKWSSVSIVLYGLVAAAMPILCYIIFNREHYTSYEGTFIHRFLAALRGHPDPDDMRYYVTQLRNCFFTVPGPRLFLPDFLPIPLPYYFFLLPGFILAVGQRRYEVVLLATLPVAGVFISGGVLVEHRLLLAIPFWVILMGFAFAGLLRLRRWPGVQILLFAMSALLLAAGLGLSIRYIYTKTKNPFTIPYFAQADVAVSRFLRNVVAGKQASNPPRLERDEFNRSNGVPDAAYETLICPRHAYSVLHLFLHNYDDTRILSFCGGYPADIMTEQDIWSRNKKAIVDYVPGNKDLKLIWESEPKTERIIERLRQRHDLATEASMSFSFGSSKGTFHVLNISSNNIRQFQERVKALPDSVP